MVNKIYISTCNRASLKYMSNESRKHYITDYVKHLVYRDNFVYEPI